MLARNKKWQQANREKIKERTRRWKVANARSVKNKYLVKTHGITIEQYEEMWTAQCGRCKICDKIPSRDPFVDHCHRTGKIRGLLCSDCNFGIRHFHDDPELLVKAFDYLHGEEMFPEHEYPKLGGC